jgi:hypothetical protein
MPPKPLEIIKCPGTIQKDVYQVVAVVHQDPLAVVVTLYADRTLTLALQLQVNLVADGLILSWVGAGAENEVIGETGYFPEVEYLDVLSFLRFSRSHGCEPRRQGCCSWICLGGGGVIKLSNRKSSLCPYRTTIRVVRRFISSVLLLYGLVAYGQTMETAAVQRATQELDKTKALVEAGALPRASIDQALLALTEAQADLVLAQALYGKPGLEDLTQEQADRMVEAARRQFDREKEKLERAKKLVEEGVAARITLTPLLENVDASRKTLDLASSRAKLVTELALMAQAEAVHNDPDQPPPDTRIAERYDGAGIFRDAEFKKVLLAYEKHFAHPLPISARGETALHRSLGFDHRGRVDVALNPDQPEGVWLRQFLAALKIPYFAFRAAIPGQATAPHIHLGLPSTRLHAAD